MAHVASTLLDLLIMLSLIVYLEYGIRFPLTGGEVHYVSYAIGLRIADLDGFLTTVADSFHLDKAKMACDLHVRHYVRLAEWKPSQCPRFWPIYSYGEYPSRRNSRSAPREALGSSTCGRGLPVAGNFSRQLHSIRKLLCTLQNRLLVCGDSHGMVCARRKAI